jgi:amidohydrolase
MTGHSERTMPADLISLRHRFHQNAEVGLQLPVTQEMILSSLADLDLEITTGSALTSVTAVLRGGSVPVAPNPRPVVLLRSDMDALEVTEPADADYPSLTQGSMHACGHDVHMAALLGAARNLHARRHLLTGDVIFMFQPGEESDHGAKLMIDEGVLEAAGHPVSAAYALHVLSSQLPMGVFASKPGPMMAGADGVRVRVNGAGAHGATPHLGKDPIVVASEMVLALQSIASRQFDVFDPVLLTVGQFHAGSHRSAIPGEAVFELSVRSFTPATREKILAAVHRLCAKIAEAHGLTATISSTAGYPALSNSAAEEAFAASVALDVFGASRYQRLMNPFPLSEDFSEVLNRVPGAFITLGACPREISPTEAPSNHSPYAVFDDRVVHDAAIMLTELAVRRVQPGSMGPQPPANSSDRDLCPETD